MYRNCTTLAQQMRCWQGVYYDPCPLSLSPLLFSLPARRRFIFPTFINCTALAQQMRCWQGVYYNPSPLCSLCSALVSALFRLVTLLQMKILTCNSQDMIIGVYYLMILRTSLHIVEFDLI